MAITRTDILSLVDSVGCCVAIKNAELIARERRGEVCFEDRKKLYSLMVMNDTLLRSYLLGDTWFSTYTPSVDISPAAAQNQLVAARAETETTFLQGIYTPEAEAAPGEYAFIELPVGSTPKTFYIEPCPYLSERSGRLRLNHNGASYTIAYAKDQMIDTSSIKTLVDQIISSNNLDIETFIGPGSRLTEALFYQDKEDALYFNSPSTNNTAFAKVGWETSLEIYEDYDREDILFGSYESDMEIQLSAVLGPIASASDFYVLGPNENAGLLFSNPDTGSISDIDQLGNMIAACGIPRAHFEITNFQYDGGSDTLNDVTILIKRLRSPALFYSFGFTLRDRTATLPDISLDWFDLDTFASFSQQAIGYRAFSTPDNTKFSTNEMDGGGVALALGTTNTFGIASPEFSVTCEMINMWTTDGTQVAINATGGANIAAALLAQTGDTYTWEEIGTAPNKRLVLTGVSRVSGNDMPISATWRLDGGNITQSTPFEAINTITVSTTETDVTVGDGDVCSGDNWSTEKLYNYLKNECAPCCGSTTSGSIQPGTPIPVIRGSNANEYIDANGNAIEVT